MCFRKPGRLSKSPKTERTCKTMWVESRQRLIALQGRDIKLECREIVFDNGRNIEVLRHPSPQAASGPIQHHSQPPDRKRPDHIAPDRKARKDTPNARI